MGKQDPPKKSGSKLTKSGKGGTNKSVKSKSVVATSEKVVKKSPRTKGSAEYDYGKKL